jgi:glutamyl-tRNA reductase
MNILVVGLNHKSAPVEVREKLAFQDASLPHALALFRRKTHSAEAVILSTCNRVELYASSEPEPIPGEVVQQFLAEFHGLDLASFAPHLYERRDQDAVRHLFRVTASLDSMVLGEPQINAQVKEAYTIAAEEEATGKVLNALFQRAFHVAKQVQASTSIAAGKLSVGSVAVDLAERIFQDFSDKVVMILGAGEMAELVLKHLAERGAEKVIVSNRSPEKAEALAKEYEGRAVPHDQLVEHLAHADILICSTAAPHYVLHPDQIRVAAKARKSRPMFLVDIAVPRNINPEVSQIENVYLYDIDDLEKVVAQSIELREKELEKCLAIVERQSEDFMRWLGTLRVGSTISGFIKSLHGIKQQELERLRPKLAHLSEKDWREIEQMADRLTNKVANQPAQTLREHAKDGAAHGLVDAIRRLFGLEGP